MSRLKRPTTGTAEPEDLNLDSLYRRHATWLRALLRKRFGASLAEDLTQETYLRLAQSDTAGIAHPRALLARTAVNIGYDQTRYHARRAGMTTVLAQRDAAEIDVPQAATQDETIRLKEIVLALPPLYRDVFLLSRFGGLTYVAGYGLRLLCVLQSPAQLRAIYGADMTEEIMSNCGAEVVFAPKELPVAQALSERLGFYTYQARSLSRPSGLGSGRRTQTRSDQRRALMLPQELMQMDRDHLIVLTAGAPPVKGRKLAFYREPAFTARVTPPPPLPTPLDLAAVAPTDLAAQSLTLAETTEVLAAEGLEPPPPHGASDADIEAWVDRFLSATAPSPELEHADR